MRVRQLGEEVICPICGKKFKITVDTVSFIAGDCTCSWKCFLNEVKRKEAEKKTKCK